MKKIILLITFTLFFVTTFAQMRKAVLTLKDSTELKGLAKIQYGKIIFKANKKAKKKTFDHTTVNHLLLHVKNDKNYIKFYYKKVVVFNEYHLLKLYSKGNISIFFEHSEYNEDTVVAGILFGIAGVAIASALSNNKTTPLNKKNYYLCKNDSESVFFFSNRNKKFKKEATEYFKDCPNLVKKINSKYFTKNNIAKMVKYYNTKCN